jgi:NADPH:quinone reductase-like Zn-dependent oxidoreductase
MERLESSTAPIHINRGDVVDGIIAGIGQDEILVDIGLRSEAVLPIQEVPTTGDWAFDQLHLKDRVLAYVIQLETPNGRTLLSSKRANLDELKPDEVRSSVTDVSTFEEAAAFPLIGVTAWNALTGGRPLQAGDTVLTLGSGGLSLFTLQFAKLFGARVIVTTSSKEREEQIKALRADAVINYCTTPDWHVAVRELTQVRKLS